MVFYQQLLRGIGDRLRFALTLFAALGCGLIAGVFFAFSTSVMKALARLPSAEGIAAMQFINVVILNPVFLGAFVGTAAACAFLVTMVCNVPRNDALAAIAPTDPDSARLWADYVATWTAWNHLRAAAALAAAASLTLALRY